MGTDIFLIQHRNIPINKGGTDFFVGDIHGEIELLMEALKRVGFDYENDRLFATGDLIDRGPDSIKCLKLLEEPWFHSVLGNHEAMFIAREIDSASQELHMKNGGSWANELCQMERRFLLDLIYVKTSLAMTISTERGNIGVIHAMAPDCWSELQKTIDDWIPYLWSMNKYSAARRKRPKSVQSIDAVVHGHVGCDYPETGANQIWIDTLIGSGKLTVLSAQQILNLAKYDWRIK
ncbi:MAG: protein phosphatase [Planctomycetes bacterium]|nr:protein phosphatase [Planctomycetota bacterium]